VTWCQKRTFVLYGAREGRHTDHLAGHRSIWTNQCPRPPSPHFLQALGPSCRSTNNVKALKATVKALKANKNEMIMKLLNSLRETLTKANISDDVDL